MNDLDHDGRGEGVVNRLNRYQAPKKELVGTGILVTPNGQRARTNPFRCALRGMVEAWKREPNMRLHVLAGWGAITVGAAVRLSATEWLAVTVAIAVVLMAELFNTAIEQVVNLVVGLRTDPVARYVKDAAAGAVLVAAAAAAVIGAVVFLPHLLAFLPGR